MEFSINDKPEDSDINEICFHLQEHNAPHWEVDDRHRYVITLKDNDQLVGGIVFNIFSEWQ
jgi:RimJ/RimL family protein N-acetyltransferase